MPGSKQKPISKRKRQYKEIDLEEVKEILQEEQDIRNMTDFVEMKYNP